MDMARRGPWIVILAAAAILNLTALAAPAGAAFPGRNGRIAVPSDRSGNFELWTVKPNGTGWRQLTNHPAFDACPAWSPDGTRLAFCSDRGGSFQVFTMRADG
jgi:Tol biopolymer transport system component